MPAMDWKQNAAYRARKLSEYIEKDFPDVMIGSQWFLFWESMLNAYGPEIFSRHEEMWNRIRDQINNEN